MRAGILEPIDPNPWRGCDSGRRHSGTVGWEALGGTCGFYAHPAAPRLPTRWDRAGFPFGLSVTGSGDPAPPDRIDGEKDRRCSSRTGPPVRPASGPRGQHEDVSDAEDPWRFALVRELDSQPAAHDREHVDRREGEPIRVDHFTALVDPNDFEAGSPDQLSHLTGRRGMSYRSFVPERSVGPGPGTRPHRCAEPSYGRHAIKGVENDSSFQSTSETSHPGTCRMS